MLERTRATSIHPTAIVESGAELGVGVRIGPFCTVSAGVRIGDGTVLHSHVVIGGETTIGADCQIHPFAVLGHPPQDLKFKGGASRLVVGDRNLIREHATMNCGAGADDPVTIVGSDGMFMIGAHVGHDCRIGDHVIVANGAAIGGYVTVGDYAYIGGLAAVHQMCRIGRCSIIGGVSGCVEDLIPYGMAVGDRARLGGLNIIGCKRRGFTRKTIHRMRAAYHILFEESDGTFADRVERVARDFADVPPVQEIVEFLRGDAKRPLCLPRAKRSV